METTRLTAITGGIGAGKSVISKVLRAMGYQVYDSDSRAKKLMDSSVEIKSRLQFHFGIDVIVDNGIIDRQRLASIVFNDNDALNILNSIVHGAVIEDIVQWRNRSNQQRIFVETAILYQSGMDRIVDDVWEVSAPESTRIQRVMSRNGISIDEARARIDSQRFEVINPHPRIHVIDNSGLRPVLPQIKSLLEPAFFVPGNV